jgi:hypothetical protein
MQRLPARHSRKLGAKVTTTASSAFCRRGPIAAGTLFPASW